MQVPMTVQPPAGGHCPWPGRLTGHGESSVRSKIEGVQPCFPRHQTPGALPVTRGHSAIPRGVTCRTRLAVRRPQPVGQIAADTVRSTGNTKVRQGTCR